MSDNRKIYYITRSFPGVLDTGGGANARLATVNYLYDNGFDIEVVTPSYNGEQSNEEGNYKIHKIKFNFNHKLDLIKEYLGFKEDYLDEWVKNSVFFLEQIIKPNDIIFCTSGGELSTFKIGSLLKKNNKIIYIANYRDPINFVKYDGDILKRKFPHINRTKLESKYISNSDLVITSSNTLKKSLKKTYPSLQVENNYFGFLKTSSVQRKELENKRINIVYGGSFSYAQKPEMLIDVFVKMDLPNIELTFIGNTDKIKNKYKNIPNLNFISSMKYQEYCEYLVNNADIGFTSLAQDIYKNCIPSKVYEYINIGIPILGMLPNGEAMEIINDNEYGVCCYYRDEKSIRHTLQSINDNKDWVKKYKENVLKDRLNWSMEKNINFLITLLKKI